MSQLSQEAALHVLRMFRGSIDRGIDLHTFFELTADLDQKRLSDDQERRADVLDTIYRLVDLGCLESRGSDFYTLTESGLDAVRHGRIEGY